MKLNTMFTIAAALMILIGLAGLRRGVRAAAMQQAMADGAYAPLDELLAAPFRATVIRQLL